MNNQLKGKFTSDGNNKILRLGTDIQWLEIINSSEATSANNGYGYKYEWSSEMGTGSYMTYHPAGDNTAANTMIDSGINVVSTFNYAIGPSVAITAGTNAVDPVYSTASTSGLSAGSIVRILTTDQKNLHGFDFTVDTVVLDTSFKLANALATAPGIIAGANGFYKIIAPNREVYDIIFPAKRVISEITQATEAEVTTLVDHNYSVGQRVRLNVPSTSGMLEINGKVATVTEVVSTGKFKVNINTIAFTAFKFPLYSVNEFTPAYAIPNGETKTLGFDGATRNASFRGVVLDAGTTSPAGNNGNVIYWRAGKSADVTE